MYWNEFVDSLQYMARGLLGIFVITGVLAALTVALLRITGRKTEK